MSDSNRSTEELRADIAETREEIGEDLDELKSRLSPEHLKEQARGKLQETKDSAVTAVKDTGRRARDSALNAARNARRNVQERASQMGSEITAEENRQPLLGAGLLLAGATLGLFGLTRRRKGIRLEESIVIDRPRWELYRFWHRLESLPRFMKHLASVTRLSPTRSHWVASGPSGSRVGWNAEIVEERESEFIAWRSLPGADVPNSGWVRFEDLPQGTRVTVSLMYNPPAGRLGAVVASLFGEEPHRQIRDDLHHLKRMMEMGGASVQGWSEQDSIAGGAYLQHRHR